MVGVWWGWDERATLRLRAAAWRTQQPLSLSAYAAAPFLTCVNCWVMTPCLALPAAYRVGMVAAPLNAC